jgi:exonuclease III
MEKRGGVCIMVKNGMNFRTLTEFSTINLDSCFECCGAYIEKFKLKFFCIYRVPTATKSKLNLFFDKFESLLYNIFKNNCKSKIVIVGDFNINLMESSVPKQKLLDLLKNFNLTSYINHPTRLKSCLDLIFSNASDAVSELLPLGLSGGTPIAV